LHEIDAVPGEYGTYSRCKEVDYYFYSVIDPGWQKPVQDGDIDVFVCPAGSDRSGHGNPQHKHAEQFVTPDKADTKYIPGHNLAGSKQDHAGQDDDENGIFHRAAQVLKPLHDGLGRVQVLPVLIDARGICALPRTIIFQQALHLVQQLNIKHAFLCQFTV